MHLPHEIKWNINLMQQGNFIDVFLAWHVLGTYAHHHEHEVLSRPATPTPHTWPMQRLSRSPYFPTPWCRILLLEKLTVLQLVKKFPAFHGTRRFITAHTSVHHLSLSWASPIQSIYPHRTSWRSILILSTHLHLCLPSGLFPSGRPPPIQKLGAENHMLQLNIQCS